MLPQILIDKDNNIDVIKDALPDSMSLLDLLIKGGWIMIPIFTLSIIALVLFLERWLIITRAKKKPKKLLDLVKKLVKIGEIDKAKSLCHKQDSIMARMLYKGLGKIGSNISTIEGAINNAGHLEIYRLEKNMGFIATIAGAAPMLGFLGTVIGMINTFHAIGQQEGSVSPKMLSGGIYEAMITTAAGLFVGLVAYLGYNYLITVIQKVIHQIEFTSIEFIDLLQEPLKKRKTK